MQCRILPGKRVVADDLAADGFAAEVDFYAEKGATKGFSPASLVGLRKGKGVILDVVVVLDVRKQDVWLCIESGMSHPLPAIHSK